MKRVLCADLQLLRKTEQRFRKSMNSFSWTRRKNGSPQAGQVVKLSLNMEHHLKRGPMNLLAFKTTVTIYIDELEKISEFFHRRLHVIRIPFQVSA